MYSVTYQHAPQDMIKGEALEIASNAESPTPHETALRCAIVAGEELCIVEGHGEPDEELEEVWEGLVAIHRFVEQLLNLDQAHDLAESQNSREAGMMRLARLNRVPTGGFLSAGFRQQYQTSEFVRIFLEAEESLNLKSRAENHNPRRRYWQRAKPLPPALATDLFELICVKAVSKNYRRRLAVRLFAAEENFRRGLVLINMLFDRRSKLNVVRIDLEYLREHRPTLDQAKRDLARLTNNYRHNSDFAKIEGFIWRLEWAPGTGYHFHFILFLNGSEARHDGFEAQKFGKYWNDVITEGRGRHYNCNFRKGNYRRLGIGMISHNDGEKRSVLVEDVLRYLAKFDELVRPRLLRGRRTFGTSQLPEPHPGTGRKRQSAYPPVAS